MKIVGGNITFFNYLLNTNNHFFDTTYSTK